MFNHYAGERGTIPLSAHAVYDRGIVATLAPSTSTRYSVSPATR